MWPTLTSDLLAATGRLGLGVAAGWPLPPGAAVAPGTGVDAPGRTAVPGAGVAPGAVTAVPVGVSEPEPVTGPVPLSPVSAVLVSPAARAISARSTWVPQPDSPRARDSVTPTATRP